MLGTPRWHGRLPRLYRANSPRQFQFRIRNGHYPFMTGEVSAIRQSNLRNIVLTLRIPVRSSRPEIFGGFFAAVCDYFVAQLRALIQGAQSRLLDGRDMDEHIFAACVGLDKS